MYVNIRLNFIHILEKELKVTSEKINAIEEAIERHEEELTDIGLMQSSTTRSMQI